MLKNIIWIFCLTVLFTNAALAKIDVVYPAQNQLTINASSTFFVGNTNKNSKFYINSNPVQLWNDEFFVHVVPLQYGENKIKLTSVSNGKTEEEIFTVKRNKPTTSGGSQIPFCSKNDNEVLYTKTIKDNATVREKPSLSSKRIVDLPKNVILYLQGSQGEFYKIEEQGDVEFWIHKSNIETPVSLSKKISPALKNIKHYSDDLYDYQKFYVSHPVLYTARQTGNNIKLTLYGIETKDENGNILQNFEYFINSDKPAAGYECIWEENKFIFKKAKLPKVDKNMPLKGVRIFIDAGHGGNERGSVGATRVNEKDINLAISNYLIAMLEKAGAIVSFSRTDDRKIGLYERVNIAKNNNAFISVSIHNNALPNGKDPYVTHGTEVYYYNENAKILAEIIKTNLANDLNLKDNGIHKASLALNRSTNPVSVLVEVAYMINPQEYILLQNAKFQEEAAKSIKKSLEEYLLSLQ